MSACLPLIFFPLLPDLPYSTVPPFSIYPPPQPFHGAKELLQSDEEWEGVPLSAVVGRARVWGLEAFQGLKKVRSADYYCRMGYKVSERGR